jgi:hypothetical protein
MNYVKILGQKLISSMPVKDMCEEASTLPTEKLIVNFGCSQI